MLQHYAVTANWHVEASRTQSQKAHANGHRIIVLPVSTSPAQTSKAIRGIAVDHEIRSVLLVGDARFGNRVDMKWSNSFVQPS